MTVASILIAFTWVVLANNGTSPKVVACSFSYSGLGVTCENHGSTLVMRSKDLRTSKNKILKALLCLCRYLVCASALQPDRICCTFPRESPHRRHFSSVTCDFFSLVVNLGRWQLLVKLLYSSDGMRWGILPWRKPRKHSSSLTFSSSHLFLISFLCHLSSDTFDCSSCWRSL